MKSLARFTKPLDNGGVIGPAQSYPGTGIWKLGTEVSAAAGPFIRGTGDIDGSNPTAFTISGLTTSDIIVAFAQGGFGDPPDQSGWTYIYDDGNTSPSIRTYYKLVSASEVSAGEITVPSGNSIFDGVFVVVADADVDSLNTYFYSTGAKSTGNVSEEAITTLSDNSLVLLLHGSRDTTTTLSYGTPPTGYTLARENSFTTNTNYSQAIAYKTVSTAGSETPGDWTPSSSTNQFTQTLAFANADTIASGFRQMLIGGTNPYGWAGTSFGGISNNTFGGETVTVIYSFFNTFTSTYQLTIRFSGNLTSSSPWSSLEFTDASGAPTFNASSVTPTYDSGNNYTQWLYSGTGTDLSNTHSYLSSNTGNVTDILWT